MLSARRGVTLCLFFTLCGPGPASATAGIARPGALALVVGSNRGGPGQRDLRYAHEDARRMAEVLTQVGGFARGEVELVLEPRRQGLLDAFSRAARRLRALASRGGQPTLFLFYYSGHARAHALSLGSEELALAEVRRQLTGLPSTARIAILDACQAGAISGIKGAVPAADFSYNTVNDLNTAGVAVMASSSATELSQEADSLRSSYFTHHLVVGLRGAADSDGDGGVTLSEAYRYAYHRTLVATARTAVGKQHVTLETRLRGKGEMTLTYPARAGSTLELPGTLRGPVLIHRQSDETVVAELSKAAGRPLRLALQPGAYVAYVGSGRPTRRCLVWLPERAIARLDPSRCPLAPPPAATVAKGREESGPRWAIELGIGGFYGRPDSYKVQLENFGFERQGLFPNAHLLASASVSRRLGPHLELVLGWSLLDRGEYQRELADLAGKRRPQTFSWSGHALGVYVRGRYPFVRGILDPYVQLGGGLGLGSTSLRDELQASPVVDDELHVGYHLGVAAGLAVMPWKHLGIVLQASYVHAPVISNMVGDVHDGGGVGFQLGARGAF